MYKLSSVPSLFVRLIIEVTGVLSSTSFKLDKTVALSVELLPVVRRLDIIDPRGLRRGENSSDGDESPGPQLLLVLVVDVVVDVQGKLLEDKCPRFKLDTLLLLLFTSAAVAVAVGVVVVVSSCKDCNNVEVSQIP